jgi:MFS family permease
MGDFGNYTHDAWYWRYIPHIREVDDYPVDEIPLLANSSGNLNKSTISYQVREINSNDEVQEEKEITPLNYEFRDEADRRWWNFFDEYEYRYPTSTIQKKGWRWYDKGTSAKEKKLILKLDLLIVLFAVISYWAKYVDQANVGNAYVSGMREELEMFGDEYSNALAMYNAGSVVFQVFYMYLFPRVSMHWMFAFGDIVWSSITILCGFIRSSNDLLICRFMTGAAEAGYFMMIHYLLGSWYKPDELGRRGGLYYCGSMLGSLTAGLLQAAIYESMDGLHGRAGWRWAFIIDGVITLPIGFVAFYMVPGTPNKCYSLFLTDDDIRLARKRLKDANIKIPSKKPPPFFNWKLWKKILTSWQIYVLSILDGLFWNSSHNNAGGYVLWLKSTERYSIPHINRLSTIPAALGVVYILAVGFSADVLRSRSKAIFWAEFVNFTGSFVLAVWFVPDGLKWYAFLISYFGITISSVVYGWLNDIMRHDPQERSIVLCWCNLFSNQFSAWVGRITYPTSQAPEFHRGYKFTTIIDVCLMVWVWVTCFFYKRQEKKDAKSNGIILYNSKTGYIPLEVAKWLDEDGKLRPNL